MGHTIKYYSTVLLILVLDGTYDHTTFRQTLHHVLASFLVGTWAPLGTSTGAAQCIRTHSERRRIVH